MKKAHIDFFYFMIPNNIVHYLDNFEKQKAILINSNEINQL
jgi:hypothetical protein